MNALTSRPQSLHRVELSQHTWKPWFTQQMRTWLSLWWRHLRSQVVAYALLAALVTLLHQHYLLGLNGSQSLPFSVYLVQKNAPVAKGDYLAFTWLGGGPYKPGATFAKQVRGVEGDTVTQVDRTFFVNGQVVGWAKETTRKGEPLALGRTGTIPVGQYYVAAPHPDSLDSRYAITGWVKQSQAIGKIVWMW